MKKTMIVILILLFAFSVTGIQTHAVTTKPDRTKGMASGKLAEEYDYWKSGKVRVCRRYDKAGDLVEVSYYRENGTMEMDEKYGEYGHKVQESYYGGNGRLRDNLDGWAVMRWKYDNGTLIEQSYYGADGKLKERKQYNKLGDLVAKNYFGDGAIDPSEEYNPGPTLAGETNAYYDSEGRPEGETSVVID